MRTQPSTEVSGPSGKHLASDSVSPSAQGPSHPPLEQRCPVGLAVALWSSLPVLSNVIALLHVAVEQWLYKKKLNISF